MHYVTRDKRRKGYTMKAYTINYEFEEKGTRTKDTATWVAENCIQALEEFEGAFADYNPGCRLTNVHVKPEGGENA